MNDVAFHFVFGTESRKYNLLHLLNAILTASGQTPIQDLALHETKLDPETVGLKSCRLDIRALTSQNHHINIEVQLMNQANMEKRSLYYWSRLFTAQLAEGEDYRELNKTIAINILDFAYLPTQKVHNIYRLLEIGTFIELSDVLEIHFLELPHLKRIVADLDCPLVRWLLFLSDQTASQVKEEIIMRDQDIRQTYEDLEKLAADKDARRLYEIREKAARDERSIVYTARMEGRELGREEGRQEGVLQATGRLVQSMLEQGLAEELILSITRLTKAELGRIKAQLSQDSGTLPKN